MTSWTPPAAPAVLTDVPIDRPAESPSADPPTVELALPRRPVPPAVPVSVPSSAARDGATVALAVAILLAMVAGVTTALVLGAVAAGPPAAAPAVAAESGAAVAPALFPVRGTVTLADARASADGASCRGAGLYTDVREGAAVTVADPMGAVVATGALGPGRPMSQVSAAGLTTCTFAFAVADVPAGSAFYLVEVGRHGAVTYRDADLRRYGATLRIGG
ncbi:hypothetical protein BJF78_08725 [Pseudonocardia sp. CNS-139]|nr:hypothetical protein BJF78_08725 [Pseudonocardia sp. CNS-139]